MWSLEDIGWVLFGLTIFAGPFVVSGWMLGYKRSVAPWLAIAAGAFILWTLVLAATAGPFDASLTTVWAILLAFFLVPAVIGSFVSEVILKRGTPSDD